ncbi:MAG TPA: sensor histidine kinase [Gaiellaceae bacterium]|nr:sensor histidine kinase [Gaiellaceae bacterium]
MTLFATAATVAVLAAPQLRFAYEAPSLRAALETASAMIALVAAYLVYGRFLRSRRVDALLLAFALGVLAASNLFLAVLVAAWPNGYGRLVAAAGSLTGALLLAAAALAPALPLPRARRAVARIAVTGLVLFGALVGLLLLAVHFYPPDVSVVSGDARGPKVESNRGLIPMHVVWIAAFAVATIGFARRSVAEEDRFLGFVAAGTALAAFARLHYLLFPPFNADWVYTGDVLRLLFYTVLLMGGAREINEYWRGLAATAVFEERRRIARELHDGVAQELAFIGRRARRLASRTGVDEARQIAAAADRALGDSRRAIATLTKPLDQQLSDVLAEAIGEVAARHPVQLDLALAHGVQVGGDAREALVRIACEAVSNAARHGQAHTVRVELENGKHVRFRVVDDGVGFDPTIPLPGHYGLVSMRERAQAVGGSFRVRSAPGAGTEVEVELP